MVSIRSFPFGVVYFQQKNAVSQGLRYLYTSPKFNSSPLKSYQPKRKGSSSNFRECIFPTICSSKISTQNHPSKVTAQHITNIRYVVLTAKWCGGAIGATSCLLHRKLTAYLLKNEGIGRPSFQRVPGNLFQPVPFVLGEWFCWVLGVSSWWKLTTMFVFQVASFFLGGCIDDPCHELLVGGSLKVASLNLKWLFHHGLELLNSWERVV